MRLVAEFTTEPFVGEGEPPAHVREAYAAAQAAGLTGEVGPFGTSVTGGRDELLGALTTIVTAAFDHGASCVTLRVERADG
ncbi:MAG: thiamine-binding protein [Nocardioidaceae bacterium]